MKKRVYLLFGLIAAIALGLGGYLLASSQYKSSLEGEWKLAGVMVDGKQAPSSDQEAEIEVVYYWEEQSVIFQPESVQGYDGCNQYQGDLKLGPGRRLDISRIISSRENCPADYQQISAHSRVMVARYDSSRFTQDLLLAERLEIRAEQLVLIDDGPPLKELFFERAE